MNQRRRVTNLGGECNSEQLKVFHHSRSCDMSLGGAWLFFWLSGSVRSSRLPR